MEEKGCKFKYVSPLSSKVIRCLDRSRYSRFPITRTFMRKIKKSLSLREVRVSEGSSYRESTALVLMAGVTMSYAVVRALEVTPCEDYM